MSHNNSVESLFQGKATQFYLSRIRTLLYRGKPRVGFSVPKLLRCQRGAGAERRNIRQIWLFPLPSRVRIAFLTPRKADSLRPGTPFQAGCTVLHRAQSPALRQVCRLTFRAPACLRQEWRWINYLNSVRFHRIVISKFRITVSIGPLFGHVASLSCADMEFTVFRHPHRFAILKRINMHSRRDAVAQAAVVTEQVKFHGLKKGHV